MSQIKEKIEEVGLTFRFLTPILIGIVGYMTVSLLGEINKKFEKIDVKFDVLIETQNSMDKRVDRLEYRIDSLNKKK